MNLNQPFSHNQWQRLLLASSGLLLASILLCLYFLIQIKNQLNDQPGNNIAHTSSAAPAPEPNATTLPTTFSANTSPIAAQAVSAMTDTNASQQQNAASSGINYLDDLAWMFNRQGALAFHQHTIDTGPILHLHELLHRLASRGFTGTAAITIYVGDFCVAKDRNGIEQLAPESNNLSDCMLASELYGMERLLADYQRETEMILRNLTGSINSTIKTDIHALPGSEPYPERLPTFFAGEWNAIAQKNNRIELVLVEDQE